MKSSPKTNYPQSSRFTINCICFGSHKSIHWSDRYQCLYFEGFPCSSVGKESVCNCLLQSVCRRPRSDSWVGKIPWGRKWQPTPVFLPGESHGQRSSIFHMKKWPGDIFFLFVCLVFLFLFLFLYFLND